MGIVFSIVLSVHVLVGVGVIVLVLLQHGKGADMGAAFGSGASGSLFGASGSANFLSRSTAFAAGVFFLATLALSFIGSRPQSGGVGVMDQVPAKTQAAPATPSAAPAQEPGKAPGQASEIPK